LGLALPPARIQHHAQQADGIISRSEAGYLDIMETPMASFVDLKLGASTSWKRQSHQNAESPSVLMMVGVDI
jgi:hypothetical protein